MKSINFIENTLQNGNKDLIIIGAGGHAVSVANIAISAGFEIKYFIDSKKHGEKIFDYKILPSFSDEDKKNKIKCVIAVGDNARRNLIFENLQSNHNNISFPALIHNSAVVSTGAHVNDGSVIMPLAVIGPNTNIGKFCIVNTKASIDHDSFMDDFSSLAPSATTGGNVFIGTRSVISIGAVVKDCIKIGNDCVLGANSYLNKDLIDNKVAYGSPAKIIRSRLYGENYLN